MAIARRPQATPPADPPGVDVDALINKGGTVAQAPAPDAGKAPKLPAFTLRVPPALLTDLDSHLKSGRIKRTRQYFILEAIVEKMERERGAGA